MKNQRLRADSIILPVLGHLTHNGIQMHTDPTPTTSDALGDYDAERDDHDPDDDLADIQAITNPVDMALRSVACQLLRENTALRRRLYDMQQLIGKISEGAIRHGRVVYEAPDFDATTEYDTLQELTDDIQESVEHDGSQLSNPYDVYIRRITITEEYYMRFRRGAVSESITAAEAGSTIREAAE